MSNPQEGPQGPGNNNVEHLRPQAQGAQAGVGSTGGGTQAVKIDTRFQGASLGWLMDHVQIETEEGADTAHNIVTADLLKVTQAVASAMRVAGKAKGKLTITIDLIGDKGMVEPVISHKTTIPKKARTIPQMMYPTEEGGFSLMDPRQYNMNFDK